MNRIMTLCAGFILSCLFSASVFAQGGYEVKGVVVDEIGPVIGATVVEKGTTNGVSTGLDGDYILKVSSEDALIEISCIGYATQTYLAKQLPATITLKEDTEFLSEAVVIGYGTVKKEDMTGSITAIKSEEINRGAIVSTQDMLKGKVAGLHVIPGDGGPGSGSTIRIRGAASLNASNDPLVIIDGVPVAVGAGAGMSNPLDMVNANDIESFTILKDASSAAIYGSRASNGVIMITTKKGKGNKMKVSYNGSASVQQNSGRLPIMTPAEYRDFVAKTFQPGTEQGKFVASLLGESNVDYHDLIFQTALSSDNNISLTGNVNDALPYRASLGYTTQEGTLIGSTYDRATLDLSVAPSLLDKHLTLNLNGKGLYSYSNYSDGGVVGNAAFFNPTQDPYFRNPDGSIDYTTCNGFWNYGGGRGDQFTQSTLVGVSPLSQLYDKVSNGRAYRFIGNANIDYKVHGLEELKFVLSLGMDYSWGRNYNGVNPGSFQAAGDSENPRIGQYSISNSVSRNEVLEAYANYNKDFGIHNLDVMAGYSWQHVYNGGQSISYFNETDEVKLNPGESIDTRYPYGASESYLVSFYSRVNYSLDSRYLFTASIRADGSSKFSPATRWGIFPSGAFAWNIAEEGFLEDASSLSQLKLRLSAGMTGQQDGISDYAHLARYKLSDDVYSVYNMGNYGYQFVYTPQAYDPNIKWETTTTYNAGIDFGFFKDRLTGSVDAYLRNTNDLLNVVTTPMGSNFGNSLLTNIGSLQNKGIEFAVNVIPVQTEDWHLSVGFNGTFQDTKFTKLNATDDPNYYEEVTTISKGTGSKLSRHQVGYAPYSYYVLQQIYDHEGNPIQNAFVDQNKDGVVNDLDKYCAGDPNPDFYFGLNLKLSYKNWDFGFNGHGSIGYTVFNDFASANSTAYINTTAGSLPNFANVVKKTGFKEANSGNQWYSDMFIEDASFFRMDDINLGYTFREIGNWGGNIRIAASCQNVFVLTKFSGIDPEVSGTSGVSNTFWPRPRTYSLRLNINF